MLTHSQESVYNRILAFGQLHFAPNVRYGLSISPRLFPLIVGPTGSGKTMLVQKAAGALEATTLRVTFGDWMPQGVRSEAGSSTLFSILECVEANARVLLHPDELDKCAEDFSSSWSRSVANDLWNALDRKFPIEPYLRKQGKPCTPRTVSALGERVLKNLWIVGSGTWQAVFNQKAVRSIGFVAGPGASSESEEELTAAIIRTKMIPDELLARFSSDLLFVHYPATVEEKSRLLDGLGITAFRDIEVLDQYCMKKALTGQPIGKFIHSGEIMRQLRYDILRGALLAADWTKLHAKEDKNMRPVESRIQSLWGHGMDQIEHVSEWDNISELFDRPNGCEFLDDPTAAVQWSLLPAQFRFKVNHLFERSVRMTD